MIAPAQLELDWLLAVYRPFLRVEEAQVILHDCSEQHVYNLMDEGRLRALDIGNGTGRRCLRFFRYSVEHVALRPQTQLRRVDIVELIPHRRHTIQRREIAAWCGCAENTVSEWGLDGPRTDTRSLYYREAVIGFFARREIGREASS